MIQISKDAEQDIEQAYRWYKEIVPSLGSDFLTELDVVLKNIDSFPSLFAPAMGRIRRALCKRFPYAVYYTTRKQEIVVIAVLHQRRSFVVLLGRGSDGVR